VTAAPFPPPPLFFCFFFSLSVRYISAMGSGMRAVINGQGKILGEVSRKGESGDECQWLYL
jgi:hypothetical protein